MIAVVELVTGEDLETVSQKLDMIGVLLVFVAGWCLFDLVWRVVLCKFRH